MSVINQQPFAAPGVLYPAIGGGGGGGGVMSSITNTGGSVECDTTNVNITSPNQIGLAGVAISLNGSSWSVNPGIFSTIALECSSINGAVPGGGGGAAVSTFTDIQVSSVAGQPGSLYILGNDAGLYNINVSSATGFTALQIGLQGGRQEVYSAVMEAPDFHTSTIKGATGQISLNPSGTEQIRIGGTGAPGDITIASVGGGNINLLGNTIATQGGFSVPGAASINSISNIVQIQPAVSTIGFFPAVSTATTGQVLISLEGTAAAFGVAAGNDTDGFGITADNGSCVLAGGGANVQVTGISSINGWSPYIKTGYATNVPSGSTILFASPFLNDNIVVMLTATDLNTSGGANPNISLLNSYGVNGVSSIGFATDTRNGGVGYNASFYWMAMPRSE